MKSSAILRKAAKMIEQQGHGFSCCAIQSVARGMDEVSGMSAILPKPLLPNVTKADVINALKYLSFVHWADYDSGHIPMLFPGLRDELPTAVNGRVTVLCLAAAIAEGDRK